MQTVLISGGAGGIGLATVKRFSAEGFQVILLDRHTIPLDDISELLGPVSQVVADLTNDSEVEQAFEEIGSDPDISRGISHLVGIAGGALPDEPPLQTKGELPNPELFLSSLDHNLVSQWRVFVQVLLYLERAAQAGESPSVTFVSSINALAPCGMPGYSAAKAGLIGLVNSLVAFLGQRGIRVNALAPGTVANTPEPCRVGA